MNREQLSVLLTGMYGPGSGSFLRTARKAHKCRGCKHHCGEAVPDGHVALIEPGELYLEILWEAEPFKSGDRYCRTCAEVILFSGAFNAVARMTRELQSAYASQMDEALAGTPIPDMEDTAVDWFGLRDVWPTVEETYGHWAETGEWNLAPIER